MTESRERDFQRNVLDLAHSLGWRHMHIGESTKRVRRKSGGYVVIADKDCQGWPDLVLVHPKRKRMLVRELKTKTGTLTKHQESWLADLGAVGCDVDVWRPADWDDIIVQLSR